MEILPETAIGLIVSEIEETIPYFEKLRIDYACNGDLTLREACEMAGVPVEEAIGVLGIMARRPAGSEDWDHRSMAEIIHYLVHYHHAFTRVQIEAVNGLLEEVCRSLGFEQPQMLLLKDLFKEMGRELNAHMTKEEDRIFPYLLQREEAEAAGTTPALLSLEDSLFGQPIRILHWEHQLTGAEWAQIRLLTDEYRPPEGMGDKVAGLLKELRELELDLHRHVSLENNVLYRRALEKGWLE